MTDFDEHDELLSAALRRRAATTGSVLTAHEAVLARAGSIRRRRAAIVGGGAMAGVLIVGFALLPRGDGTSIDTTDTGDVMPSVQSTDATDVPGPTTSAPDDGVRTTTVEVAPPVDSDPLRTSTTTTEDRGSDTTGAQAAVVPSTRAPATTVPSTASPGTTSPGTSATTPPTSPSSSPSSTSVQSTSPPPTTLAPFTRTYDSTGGSITVSWNGSSLSLVSVAPQAGYGSEVEDASAQRVRVRFRSDGGDSRIEVRVDAGVLRVDIS